MASCPRTPPSGGRRREPTAERGTLALRLVDPRTLPRDAQRRVHRAVLFGERLANPKERRAAVAVARRWQVQPVRTALPMVVGVLAGLGLLWLGLRLLRPAWAADAFTGGGVLGGLVGAVLGCAIMILLQRHMAKRAEELNADGKGRGAGGTGKRRRGKGSGA